MFGPEHRQCRRAGCRPKHNIVVRHTGSDARSAQAVVYRKTYEPAARAPSDDLGHLLSKPRIAIMEHLLTSPPALARSGTHRYRPYLHDHELSVMLYICRESRAYSISKSGTPPGPPARGWGITAYMKHPELRRIPWSLGFRLQPDIASSIERIDSYMNAHPEEQPSTRSMPSTAQDAHPLPLSLGSIPVSITSSS